ncbi:MAG: hypothetical protein SF002_11935 [Alphaproteobacteria bacterium]|nr:hypothetical protein [Alphaproteobacteria bacterium]
MTSNSSDNTVVDITGVLAARREGGGNITGRTEWYEITAALTVDAYEKLDAIAREKGFADAEALLQACLRHLLDSTPRHPATGAKPASNFFFNPAR